MKRQMPLCKLQIPDPESNSTHRSLPAPFYATTFWGFDGPLIGGAIPTHHVDAVAAAQLQRHGTVGGNFCEATHVAGNLAILAVHSCKEVLFTVPKSSFD